MTFQDEYKRDWDRAADLLVAFQGNGFRPGKRQVVIPADACYERCGADTYGRSYTVSDRLQALFKARYGSRKAAARQVVARVVRDYLWRQKLLPAIGVDGTATAPEVLQTYMDSDLLAAYRADFPILQRQLHGKPIIYLDSAATSLKPQPVIDAVTRFYTHYTANIHRAVHALSEEATEAFEAAREKVARFVNADAREIVFTRGATESLNVVAHALRERGPVLVLLSEHHSNLLPWRNGDSVVIELLPSGAIDLDDLARKIAQHKPTLISLSTISNTLGVAQPVAEITAMARQAGAYTLLDVSQSVGHQPVDVQTLDCDFACFSAHKMLAPSGVGVLYYRESLRDLLKPLLTGGSMISAVHRDDVELQALPWQLEAGMPNIEGVIGLGAACDYLDQVGIEAIHQHCRILTETIRSGLSKHPKVTLHTPIDAAIDAIVSFSVRNLEAHGVARILSNRFGMLVRSGYHCAQPLHEVCGFPESVRASVHFYNTLDEVRAFIQAVSMIADI